MSCGIWPHVIWQKCNWLLKLLPQSLGLTIEGPNFSETPVSFYQITGVTSQKRRFHNYPWQPHISHGSSTLQAQVAGVIKTCRFNPLHFYDTSSREPRTKLPSARANPCGLLPAARYRFREDARLGARTWRQRWTLNGWRGVSWEWRLAWPVGPFVLDTPPHSGILVLLSTDQLFYYYAQTCYAPASVGTSSTQYLLSRGYHIAAIV